MTHGVYGNDRDSVQVFLPVLGRSRPVWVWACITPFCWIVSCLFLGCCECLAADSVAPEVTYLQDIKPLFQARCTSCHGSLQQKAGLRLDTVAFMLKGGKSGPAIQPRDVAQSRLIQRVAASDLDERMPPEHEGEPFSTAHIQRLRVWIQSGASGPPDEVPESDPRDHWAFRPRTRPVVSENPGWATASVRNPVDAILARERAERGLAPQPEASADVLIRRLYLDLIGLPPTRGEVRAFERDSSPQAYERVVERLLQDPRHGERWARHWMDIWRYSDWWGLGDQLRNSQKHIWHWRDWIVESLNRDLPYDEMIRQMLAADELYPNDLDKLRATGFLARNYFLFNRNQWMDETVEHVSKGFLGLTLNCAKCHDHKYDPFSQADYYRMRAIFEPYHVRLDVVPGESDLGRDAIPRVFDGLLNAPTYRFVRGQETQPDKSVVIAPGVPSVFGLGGLEIQSMDLPAEAWRPEQRAWVFDAYRAAAQSKIAPLQTALRTAEERWQTVQGSNDSSKTALAEVELGRVAAREQLALAEAELASIDGRADAQRMAWLRTISGLGESSLSPASVELDSEKRRCAVQAERQVALVRARLAVNAAEFKELRSAPDKKAAAEKELKAVREGLEKAEQKVAAAIGAEETFTPLSGAAWTPTRFYDSTKDDPNVVFPARSTGRRTALARWITDPRHPLTARVAVNHLWNRHFGAPLVSPIFDFGRKTPSPIHRELIDWLASELVDGGWSLKRLHRVMVMSSAYRMSSSVAGGESNLAKDPDNLGLWRRLPIRLEAQAVRDAILELSGELDLTSGGPSIVASVQGDSRRRSLYFYHSNNDRNLFLTTFDEANVKECYRREQTIVPQQALALANSRLVLDAAGRIAVRLAKGLAGGVDESSRFVKDSAFIRNAFMEVLGFGPNEEELEASRAALREWRALARIDSQSSELDPGYVHLVWALLNHNDFVTLR